MPNAKMNPKVFEFSPRLSMLKFTFDHNYSQNMLTLNKVLHGATLLEHISSR